jgi:hypothetical protein
MILLAMMLAAMVANDRGGHRGSRRLFDPPRGTGPILSPPRRTARCSLLRLPAIISARSISIQTAHSAGTALLRQGSRRTEEDSRGGL